MHKMRNEPSLWYEAPCCMSASCITLVPQIRLQRTLCVGRPIVSDSWVEACGRSSSFVDPLDHLLIDKAAQKKFGFDMRTSYQRAQHQLLLAGLHIFFTPGEAAAAALFRLSGRC